MANFYLRGEILLALESSTFGFWVLIVVSIRFAKTEKVALFPRIFLISWLHETPFKRRANRNRSRSFFIRPIFSFSSLFRDRSKIRQKNVRKSIGKYRWSKCIMREITIFLCMIFVKDLLLASLLFRWTTIFLILWNIGTKIEQFFLWKEIWI